MVLSLNCSFSAWWLPQGKDDREEFFLCRNNMVQFFSLQLPRVPLAVSTDPSGSPSIYPSAASGPFWNHHHAPVRGYYSTWAAWLARWSKSEYLYLYRAQCGGGHQCGFSQRLVWWMKILREIQEMVVACNVMHACIQKREGNCSFAQRQ